MNTSNIQKVDIHTHILPPVIPKFKDKFGYGEFISLEHDHQNGCADMVRDDGFFFRKIDSNCWSPEKRIEECKEAGVHIQVLSTVPVMFSYWTKPQDGLYISQFLNDHIANVCSKWPQHFWGLGTLPMQDTDLALKELERCIKELGLKGIQIGSHINDMNLNHSNLFPIFEAAQDLKASIFVHPWEMMGKEKMQDYWLPWLVGMPAETSLSICSMIFGGIFEKLPQLKVAFAHGGGSFPGTIGRIEHGFNVRPDLCAKDNNVNPRKYLKSIYLDSLVHDKDALRYIVSLVGAEKVLLGSDYPFPLGEHVPGQLIESIDEFTTKQKQQLLFKTAFDWLGIESQ